MPILSSVTRRGLFAMAAALAFAAPMAAQVDNIRLVHRFRVKPDRMGDFRAILRDAKAVLVKEQFNRASLWYESLSGPTELVWVRYYKTFAEAGAMNPIASNPAIVALSTRLGTTIESREILMDEVIPEASVLPTGELPPLVQTLRTRVHPGKGNDYVALVKNELIPALRKAGVPVYVFARRRMGGPGDTFTSARSLKGWGDLDGTPELRRILGEGAYEKFLAKRNALVMESEVTLYRILPDISYRPK